MRRLLVTLAVGLVAGAVVAWTFKPAPPPTYREVEVPVGAILKLEPKFELSWLKEPLEKFLRESLELQQRAVARGGAIREVSEFCAPVVRHVVSDSAGPTGLPSAPIPVADDELRAAILSYRVSAPWNPWGKKKIEHFGMTNAGDRFHDTFAGGGEIAGGVDGGRTVAQGSRWWWIQPTVTHGAFLGIGLVGGRASCGP